MRNAGRSEDELNLVIIHAALGTWSLGSTGRSTVTLEDPAILAPHLPTCARECSLGRRSRDVRDDGPRPPKRARLVRVWRPGRHAWPVTLCRKVARPGAGEPEALSPPPGPCDRRRCGGGGGGGVPKSSQTFLPSTAASAPYRLPAPVAAAMLAASVAGVTAAAAGLATAASAGLAKSGPSWTAARRQVGAAQQQPPFPPG